MSNARSINTVETTYTYPFPFSPTSHSQNDKLECTSYTKESDSIENREGDTKHQMLRLPPAVPSSFAKIFDGGFQSQKISMLRGSRSRAANAFFPFRSTRGIIRTHPSPHRSPLPPAMHIPSRAIDGRASQKPSGYYTKTFPPFKYPILI